MWLMHVPEDTQNPMAITSRQCILLRKKKICLLTVWTLKCLRAGGHFKVSCIRLECDGMTHVKKKKKKSARVQYLSSVFIDGTCFNSGSSGRSTVFRWQVKYTTQMKMEWNQHRNKPYVWSILENLLKKMNFSYDWKSTNQGFAFQRR